MKLKIHHPRLLILMLIVIGALATAGVLIADRDGAETLETTAFSLPGSPDMEPPTDEEVNDAMTIAREAGWISAIAGDQEWTLLDRKWGYQPKWLSIPGAKQYGIMFTVVWETAVDSDGPWYKFTCQRTRLRQGHTTFTNVHTLKIIVDMDRRAPVTRGVVSPFYGSEQDSWSPVYHGVPPENDVVTIKGTGSGQVLYEGSEGSTPGKLQKCPRGKEDYRD